MKEKLHYDDKGSTFKEAFAEARKEGKKSFEWNDKKYSTEVKSPKASMDEGIPKKTRADEKVGKGYEDVGKEKKEEKEDKRSRGVAAGLASTGVALGAAAALSGMKKSEQERKERALAKGKEERSMRSPVRSISTEEAAWEGEGGRAFRKGGKVSSASSRADGIAQRGKTKGRIC
jgi:hypothetical protein